jgi:hypothetical protein
VDGSDLEYVDNYKYLGVWLDCTLSFLTHIKHLQSKIKTRISFLFYNKASFTHAAKHTLVKLTILQNLDFGDVIYKIASNTVLNKLDAVYHSAIRFVIKAPYTTHHCDLYALVGWPSQAPILIDGAVVEQVESFKFLSVNITNKLTWSKHTKTVVKSAWQNLFPPRRLKRFGMGSQNLKRFYSGTIESMTGRITEWYGNCSASDHKALQRVLRTAQYITGAKLPAIKDLYTRWCQRKALNIVNDSRHRSHRLLSLVPYGKRYRSTKSRSKKLLNSFYPQVIRHLNI